MCSLPSFPRPCKGDRDGLKRRRPLPRIWRQGRARAAGLRLPHPRHCVLPVIQIRCQPGWVKPIVASTLEWGGGHSGGKGGTRSLPFRQAVASPCTGAALWHYPGTTLPIKLNKGGGSLGWGGKLPAGRRPEGMLREGGQGPGAGPCPRGASQRERSPRPTWARTGPLG